jgi:hypothetical protein
MDDALRAYNAGRADGGAERRDPAQAEHPTTGPDYRIGLLDGRLEVFRLLARVRKILDGNENS